jgi:hypothetical protein
MSKPLCVIQAPVFSRSGYGDWSKEVVKSVIRYDKFDVRIAATKWGGNVIKRTNEELDPSDPMNKVLFEKTLREPLNRQPDVFIQISIPNEFNPIGKYNIGMTAGIETTAAAGEWIEDRRLSMVRRPDHAGVAGGGWSEAGCAALSGLCAEGFQGLGEQEHALSRAARGAGVGVDAESFPSALRHP